MVARRHHFISQCYLRGFTIDPKQPQLFVTDFKIRKQFRTSPTQVALEENFHTVDIPGQPPDVVEKQIGEFENELGRRCSASVKPAPSPTTMTAAC